MIYKACLDDYVFVSSDDGAEEGVSSGMLWKVSCLSIQYLWHASVYNLTRLERVTMAEMQYSNCIPAWYSVRGSCSHSVETWDFRPLNLAYL